MEDGGGGATEPWHENLDKAIDLAVMSVSFRHSAADINSYPVLLVATVLHHLPNSVPLLGHLASTMLVLDLLTSMLPSKTSL